jgi:hypothetical protein
MQRNATLFTAKAEMQNEAKVNLGDLQKHGSGCGAMQRSAALCSASAPTWWKMQNEPTVSSNPTPNGRWIT